MNLLRIQILAKDHAAYQLMKRDQKKRLPFLEKDFQNYVDHLHVASLIDLQ